MLNLPTPFERCVGGPQPVDIELDASDDRSVLAGIVKKLLPASETDDQQKCIAFLKYVAASLELKSHAGSATAILHDSHAACDGMARVFNALCRTAGIPCRDVGMYGLEGMGSHALSEAYYEDQWHLFDPTFGVFFRSQAGTILSVHELMEKPDAGEMVCSVQEPWSGYGEAVAKSPAVAASLDFMKEKYGYALPEQYRHWFRTAYPVTYRQAATSFPVKVDLTEKREFRCHAPGAPDEGDPNLRIGIDPDTGWTSVGFAFSHTLMIKLVSGEALELEYRFTSTPPDLQLMPLAGLRVLERHVDETAVRFLVGSTAAECVAMVTAQTFGRVAAIRVASASSIGID